MKYEPDYQSLLTQPQPTIVLSNVYSDSNLGGAAITELTARFARRLVPNARLALITVPSGVASRSAGRGLEVSADPGSVLTVPPLLSTPGGIRTIIGIAAGLVRLLGPRVVRERGDGFPEVASAVAVVSKGGYLFGYRAGMKSLLGLLATSYPLLFAARSGVPTLAYSTSVGPFSNRLHRWIVGVVLRRLTAIGVRDVGSRRRTLELGVPSDRVVLMPDCVLSWEPPREKADDEERDRERLSIVVRDVPELRGLLSELLEVLHRCDDEGVYTSFQVVVQSLEDLSISTELTTQMQDLGLRAICVNPADSGLDSSAEAALNTYRRSGATLSLRLHGAIFSMLAGAPPVVIAADPGKAEGVFAGLGLGDLVLAPSSGVADNIFARLVDAKRPGAVQRVQSAIAQAAREVDEAEARIEELIERHRQRRRGPDPDSPRSP